MPGPASGSAAADAPADAVVWVVDDDSEARERVAEAGASCGLAVRAFADVALFLRSFDPERAGCVIFDAQLPDGMGLQLLAELAARFVRIPLIATLGHVDIPLVVRLLRGGAFDVLEKPFSLESLAQAMTGAVAMDQERRRAQSAHEDVRQRLKRLTRREREVLQLVASGMTSKCIASTLELCERTIEIYRSRIKKKMNSRNAADLVRQINLIGADLGAAERPTRTAAGVPG